MSKELEIIMNQKQSLEELEQIIEELKEENKRIPIIVEGEKDIIALKKLGITGIIISVNQGKTIIDFCDWITEHYSEVIILTDWDRMGGRLCRTMMTNWEGRIKYNISFREAFAKHAVIRTVEGLPSWIETMKGKINTSEKKNY
jgi:5S rRNA maturation endonuclease (ribonuclease M5)